MCTNLEALPQCIKGDLQIICVDGDNREIHSACTVYVASLLSLQLMIIAPCVTATSLHLSTRKEHVPKSSTNVASYLSNSAAQTPSQLPRAAVAATLHVCIADGALTVGRHVRQRCFRNHLGDPKSLTGKSTCKRSSVSNDQLPGAILHSHPWWLHTTLH